MTETLSNAYALVVGIAGYPSIQKLPYTEDATEVAALLADGEVCGYTGVEALSEAAANRDAILGGLDRLAEVPEGSTVLIYFSGHGASLADGAYLLPYDTVYPGDDELRRTSISSAMLTEKLGKIARRAERLTVILDCCHAGGIGDIYAPKHLRAAGAQPGLPEDMVASLGTGKGRAIFAAALPDRPAYVREGARHGHFTQCLIDGLRGGARGRQGVIRLGDLQSHIRDCLSRAKPPQEPYFKHEGTDYPIAKHLGGKAGSGAVVKGGLEALIRLAGDPQIRAKIVGIRGHLGAAYDEIGAVVGLKALHDRLHDIQVNPYEQILNERPRLFDPTATGNIARYARRVAREVPPMRDDAGRAYPGAGPIDWIEALQGGTEALLRGVQESSFDAIDDGIWALNDVLSTAPSRINTDLLDHVRRMDLRELFRALLGVQARLEELRVPAEEARRFAAGGRDLGRLDRDLDDLMSQHDGWQEADNWMRLIDNNWRGNPRELDSAWPRLSARLAGLLEAVPEPRSGEIRGATEQVADRLATRADREAKLAAFRDLRDVAIQWFYELDQMLRDRSEELKLINAALGAVLDIVMEADR
jgi:hypothetical protein